MTIAAAPDRQATNLASSRTPRFGSSFKRLLVACLAGVVLLLAATTRAQGLRVRVQLPLADDPVLDEAVVHVIGELSSLGFEVEVLKRRTSSAELESRPGLDPGTEGALIFSRSGNTLRISAWAANGDIAFVETLDTADPAVTPQVIAVRGVEALRGVLIEPKAPQSDGAASSEMSPNPAADPAPLPIVTRRSSGAEPSPLAGQLHEGPSAPWAAQALVGPSIGIESAGLETIGVGGSITVGSATLQGGIALDALLHSGSVSAPVGTATIGRERVLAIARLQAQLSSSTAAFLQVGAGAARYTVDPRAAEGFAATSRQSTEVAGQLAVGTVLWASRGAGFFAAAEATSLLTPIRVHMSEEAVGTLGIPSASFTLGLAARYP